MTTTESRPTLTVYLRASSPRPARERQRELIERVERLAADGRVSDVRVRRWDDRLVASDDADAVTTFEAFTARAAEIDHTLEPFFQEHERADAREIVVPIICVAVYAGRELRRVFPCRDAEGVYSVWDCLRALETDGELGHMAE